MNIVCQEMIIIVDVLTRNEHNTKKPKKRKIATFHFDGIHCQYNMIFFDYACETSLNNSVLTTMQSMEMILLSMTSMDDINTDIMGVYPVQYIVQQLVIILLLMIIKPRWNLFVICF